MRYQSEHGFIHPVLSPESDHYPNGQFTTKLLKPDAKDGNIQVILEFNLQEPTLEKLIEEGAARCVAMLYCRATLHQQTLRAHNHNMHINTTISTTFLRDAIEIHPLIVAAKTTEIDTSTADPFYQNTKPTAQEGEPLATDRTWHFNLDVDTLPIGSIFQFKPEPELMGPMKIEIAPEETYINIHLNAGDLQELNIAQQQGLTIPSIISAALVQAVHEIQELDPNDQFIIPGWVDTIRKQSEKTNIDLNKGGTNPFEAAQTLLSNPFQNLPKFQIPDAAEQVE